MIKIEFEDGEVRDYSDNEIVEIVNYPTSNIPKDGYFRIKEYPPTFIKTTTFRMNVVSKGTRIYTNRGIQIVKSRTEKSN